MKTVNNLPHLSTMLCSFLVILSCFFTITACSSEISLVEKEVPPSSDVKAVVLIPSPKVGTLLQLKGIAGKGKLIVHKQGKMTCVSSPIRIAAGSFGGDSIAIHSADSIRLAIYSNDIVKRLLSGDEIVSDQYRVSDASEEMLGDIRIESGLTLSYGFVLNPGEWSWSSLFGMDQEEVDCSMMQEDAI